MSQVTAVILAAGEGKRMRSRQPKVLHPLCGRPLLAYGLRTARALADRIVVVVGPTADGVRAVAGEGVTVVEQRERLGTGHAVLQARPACGEGTILVLPGDTPLLSGETLERLVRHHRSTGAVATVLTAVVDRPQGYGRILRQSGRVKRIVEDRDATDDQKKIVEINTSVYCLEAKRLWKALAEVKPDNDQGEYYLTDVIGILARASGRIEAVAAPDPVEALGINDRKQLAALAAIQRRRILDQLMEAGVTILDPASTSIEDAGTIFVNYDGAAKHQTVVGDGAFVGSNSSLVAPLTVGEGAYIAAGSVITKDVPADALVLERSPLVVKEGWAARRRATRAAKPKE